MATDWNALTAEEDRAYFMAELVEISPQSFTLEEKQRILRNMIEAVRSNRERDARRLRSPRRGDPNSPDRHARRGGPERPRLVVPNARSRP